MRTLTFEKFINKFYPELEYVDVANESYDPLKDNEWFALMVIDDNFPGNNSPHVKALSINGMGIVGLECTGDNRVYLSKEYNKHRRDVRGECIIVECDDTSNYCIL